MSLKSHCKGINQILHAFQVPEYEYPKDSIPDYLTILVPNVDNVRTDFLIGAIAKQGKAVLLIGEQVSCHNNQTYIMLS